MHCVSLGNSSFEECKCHVSKHPLVELRLDTLGLTLDEIEALCKTASKIIATCRLLNVGEEKQRDLLLHAIKCGVAYVDLELEASDMQQIVINACAQCKNTSLIISYHNFIETPDSITLEEIVHACSSKGADIVKIACMVQDSSDNLRLLSLLQLQRRLIVVGMGEKGKITRIAAPLLGALWTYVALEEGKETAEGQLSLSDYSDIMNKLSESKH
ncbi:MAG: type I 3-dehydroquinate dehydratase [SAR324 cluster bacterium]|uniref:3-dehydroquinate dehydratase n=1 Tax=SAR324 cluster bacterium TaxID=2024889 RepID=A0A7X9FTN6_9DELT|nr:type I 3-dehydroquinate dehydratase [SAR324 cluster bacterium]